MDFGLNKLQFFLGIYFERDRGTIHQRSYIENILEGFGVGDCKPIGTRLDIKTSLKKLSEEEHKEYSHKIKKIMYQEAMGSLMLRDGGHKTRPQICNKCDKPIYVETWFNSLDGG